MKKKFTALSPVLPGIHAQGVALGATKNGIKSLIRLPAGAPISKVEATKKYGAEVCLCRRSL